MPCFYRRFGISCSEMQRQPFPHASGHGCREIAVPPYAPLPHPHPTAVARSLIGVFSVVATAGPRTAFTGPASVAHITPHDAVDHRTPPHAAPYTHQLRSDPRPLGRSHPACRVTYRACASRHTSTSTVVCVEGSYTSQR
jgi:hypothetical protein